MNLKKYLIFSSELMKGLVGFI